MENIENIANKSKYELLNENFLTLFNDNISYKNANDLIISGKFKKELDYINTLENGQIKYDKQFDFYIELLDCCSQVCLNPDNRIRKSLYDIGMTEKDLYWLIPVNELLKEINRINEEGNYFILIPILFSFLFFIYLPGKIKMTLLNNFKFKLDKNSKIKTDYTFLKEVLNNYNRRRNYSTKRPKKEKYILFDTIWDIINSLSEFEIIETFKYENAAHFLQKFDTDSFDDVLIPIYHEAILDLNKKSENHKLKTAYMLYTYMLTHRELPRNEKEFKDSPLGSGENFKSYPLAFMKNYIYRKVKFSKSK